MKESPVFGGAAAYAVCGLLALGSHPAYADPASPLIAAAKGQKQAVALQLVAKGGVDLDAREGDGSTALHWATYHDDTTLVELLLSNGVNANAVTRYGVTPLGLAAENRNAWVTELLLNAGADPNLDMSGQAALHIAARTNAVDIARLLIGHGASLDARTDWQGATPLMVAVSERNALVAEFLLSVGSDANAKAAETPLFIGPGDESTTFAQIPRGGMTPLMFAARDGCLECLAPLLKAGADVNHQDRARVTPLNLAIYNGHYDVAAALIDAGANPEDDSVFIAVDMNNLVANGVNADNYPVPRTSSKRSSVDVLRILLARGANPDHELMKEIQSRNLGFWRPGYVTGVTPLQRAAQQADLASMRLLLDAGADPSLATRARTKGTGGYGVTVGGETPLMFAIRSVSGVPAGTLGNRPGALAYRARTPGDSAAAAALLLAKGAKPNASDWAGNTALHVAAELGANDLIELLAQAGADLAAKNYDGATPLDVVLAQKRAAGQLVPPVQPAGEASSIEATETLLRQLSVTEKAGQ